MSFTSSALLLLAEQNPALAYSVFQKALWEEDGNKLRDRGDTDISGDGIEHYGPALTLHDGAMPVARLEVMHEDYYADVVTISHYADGSEMITIHAYIDGFGVAKRPVADWHVYEIIRLP